MSADGISTVFMQSLLIHTKLFLRSGTTDPGQSPCPPRGTLLLAATDTHIIFGRAARLALSGEPNSFPTISNGVPCTFGLNFVKNVLIVGAKFGKNVFHTCSKTQVPCKNTFCEYCNQLVVSFANKLSAVSSYTVVCDSANIASVNAFIVLSRCAERSFNNSSYLSCNPPSRIGQYFITLNRSSRKIALAKSIGISFPSTSVKTFLNDAIASFSAFVWMGLPVRLDFRIPSSCSCEVDNGDVEVGGFGRVLVGVERGYLLIASLRLLENVTKTLYFLFARLLIAY
jgi:hypothetical protein